MYISDFQAVKCAFLIGPVLWDVCLWLADEDESHQHTLAELKVSLCDSVHSAKWVWYTRSVRQIEKNCHAGVWVHRIQLMGFQRPIKQTFKSVSCNHCTFTSYKRLLTTPLIQKEPGKSCFGDLAWLMWVEIIDSFSQTLSDARTLLTVTWRNAVRCPPTASVSVELLKTRVILSAAGERMWCFQSMSQDENTRKNKHLSAEVGQCVFNVVLMWPMMLWRLTDASHTRDLGWESWDMKQFWLQFQLRFR